MKKIEMVGKKYGKLKVLSEHSKTRNGHIRYTCECECGNTANVLGTHLRQGNSKSCGCKQNKRGNDNPLWGGVGELSADFWYGHIVRSAEGAKGRSKIALTIDKEYAWNLFLEQGRKCKLSGIELKFPTYGKDKAWTASLDRIDSSEGYIDGNVQWVHKDVNMMKRTYTQEHFVTVCKRIAEVDELEKDDIVFVEPTIRGKLVKMVTNDFMLNNIFEPIDIKDKFQLELDRHLDFECKITVKEDNHNSLTCNIYYESVDGEKNYNCTSVTVVSSGMIV